MSEASLSLAAEVLKEAYAALNRNNVPGFVHMFDEQVERVEHFPSGETHRGLAAVKAHIAQGRGSWAEGSCNPKRFIVVGDKVVVLVRVRVRLEHEKEWRDARVADVFTFRDGKVVQFHTFAQERDAFEWAGAVSDEDGFSAGS